jgi:hypothetical protein
MAEWLVQVAAGGQGSGESRHPVSWTANASPRSCRAGAARSPFLMRTWKMAPPRELASERGPRSARLEYLALQAKAVHADCQGISLRAKPNQQIGITRV